MFIHREEEIGYYYWFNEIAGIVPGIHTMALKLKFQTAKSKMRFAIKLAINNGYRRGRS
jgi:hypothetical protein